jgi:hypothetical protein
MSRTLVLTADLIAEMIVCAAAETGVDPVEVMDPRKRGPLWPSIVETRRAVCLALPSIPAAARLAFRLKWWGSKDSALSQIVNARRRGEDKSAACQEARDCLPAGPGLRPLPDEELPRAAPVEAAGQAPAPRKRIDPPDPASRSAGAGAVSLVKPRSEAPSAVLRSLSDKESAAVEEFLKRSKVTVCPPGQAAGLSSLETKFSAVPPPKPEHLVRAHARRHRKLRVQDTAAGGQ